MGCFHCFYTAHFLTFFLQNLSTTVRPRSQAPIYAIRLPGSQSSSAASASTSNTSVRTSGSVYIVPKQSANGVSPTAISGSGAFAGSSRSSTIPSALQSSPAPILASAKMVLMVEVTNVWFGAARCKPCQPVVISEQGIKLVFKDGDNSRWIYISTSLAVFLACRILIVHLVHTLTSAIKLSLQVC